MTFLQLENAVEYEDGVEHSEEMTRVRRMAYEKIKTEGATHGI